MSHGERLAECAALAESSEEVVAVGVNCTAPRFVESLIAEAASATAKPIVVYPNSGEGWDSRSGRWIGLRNGMPQLDTAGRRRGVAQVRA